jgi:hypothetical protein
VRTGIPPAISASRGGSRTRPPRRRRVRSPHKVVEWHSDRSGGAGLVDRRLHAHERRAVHPHELLEHARLIDDHDGDGTDMVLASAAAASISALDCPPDGLGRIRESALFDFLSWSGGRSERAWRRGIRPQDRPNRGKSKIGSACISRLRLWIGSTCGLSSAPGGGRGAAFRAC